MAEGIRKKGATYSYRVNYKSETTGKWKTIEKGGFRTIAEAKAARAERQAEINSNPSSVLVKDKAINLEEVYNTFITKRAQCHRTKSTLKRYDSLFRNHLKPKWGNKQIEKIQATDLTDYLFSLTTTHSHSYIESIHKFMKVLWNFAYDREYMKENKIVKVKTPDKETKEEVKIYTEEELDMFEKRFSSTNLIIAFKLGRALGLRIGECFGLLWSDIDWKNREININKQLVYEDKMWTLRSTKTNKSNRTIDLQDDIYDYLKELKKQQEKQKEELGIAYRSIKVAIDKGRNKSKEIIENLDFINVKGNGDLLTTDSAKILGRIARDELGINFKYHNLRHTHASRLAEKNIPIVVVKKRLGHAKEETTLKYYTHITPVMRENLLNSLNELAKCN
ncbi:MAG: site-specific integrase [Tepidibacter sp.]|jgi:integrase|uniref:tyrosine-type recombinase/integrase n=1 Tax=Tepidibacter sp. TaxID=2529387 RepID=UPI0025DADB5B|nr:site-specific integrase [Tepidibacter sp.]MCT4507349.1 site-specific integrase [Tepidibacter sp.]